MKALNLAAVLPEAEGHPGPIGIRGLSGPLILCRTLSAGMPICDTTVEVATQAEVGLSACMPGHVYILASKMHGTLYTGVTSDIYRRVLEHRQSDIPGFTAKYGVKRLVWYRFYDDIEDAITDEKRIKRWRRKWKLELIESMNPEWLDLFDGIARG